MGKFITSVLAVAFTCGAANAMPFFWHSNPQHIPPANGECTDFSGTYRGACTGDHARTDESFKVEQNQCESLNVKGHELPIGALLTGTVATPALGTKPAKAMTGTMSVAWSTDKKSLLLSANGSGLELGASRTLSTKSLEGGMRLEGNKLIVTLKDKNGKEVVNCSWIRE